MRSFLIGIVLLCCGCDWTSAVKKTQVSTDDTEWTEHHDRIERTHQEGSDFDTKTVKEEAAVVVETPDGPLLVRVPRSGAPVKLPKDSKVTGTVPLTVTTVDQDNHVGAKDTTKQDAVDKKKDEKKKDDVKVETEKEVGLPLKFYFAGLLCILLILAGVFLYVRHATRVIP
jgi:hypothetical protein